MDDAAVAAEAACDAVVSSPLSVLVMAKAAVPGRVKTRLTRGPGALSPDAAAAVHAAMLDTVLARLRPLVVGGGAAVLALDDPALAPEAAAEHGWTVVPQGTGDLGQRIARAWRHVPGPAAVFGVDSPDVPAAVLQMIHRGLSPHHPPLGGVGHGSAGPGGARGDTLHAPAERPPSPNPSQGEGGPPPPPPGGVGPGSAGPGGARGDPLHAPAEPPSPSPSQGEGGPNHPPPGGVGPTSAGPGGARGDSQHTPAERPPSPNPSQGEGGASHALLGPVTDGGYWTLAARELPLALLQNIDWGTPAVYDQTHAAARTAGLALADLPPWHDVDDAADLAALRTRLAAVDPAAEPALRSLARRFDDLLGPAPT